MIDLVGKIVTWLLVGHSTTSKIIRYILFFVIAILCVLEIGFYKHFNYFSFKDLFAMPTITILFEENKKIIGIIGAINTLFFLIVYLLQDKKMRERKNCGLRQIALEDIARIWVEQEDYKQTIKEELKQEIPPPQTETKIVIPNFKTEEVKAFLANLIARGDSPATIALARASLVFYFNNVLKKKIEIKTPKIPKKIPTVLTREEIKRMIELTKNFKHRLIIELLYSTGVRLSELRNLKISNCL